ncbi:MAG: DNA repair protein RecN [Rhodospirillales bacterium]
MLVSLGVRNVVLVDELSIGFEPGLCALTGETGAGKSILLDALGLALGARGDAGLVRSVDGKAAGPASVSASFDVPAGHPALMLLEEQGLPAPAPGEPLILRRTLGADGRSRAFVNDEPVGVGFLKTLGEALVEIEGQFASQGLLDPATHRASLDAMGDLAASRVAAIDAYRRWKAADAALAAARADFERDRAEEEYLRHAAAEMATLDPQPGEEATLSDSRALLMHGEKLAEAMHTALAALTGNDGATARLVSARRTLARGADKAAAMLDGALAALDRAGDETAEAVAVIEKAARDIDGDPRKLEKIEERLFALRALARKHRTTVDELPALRADFDSRLAAITDSGARIAALEKEVSAARALYVAAAETLSAGRRVAAQTLDAAVAAELAPLKLEKAVFRTRVERLAEDDWSEHGMDRVAFEVATNRGAAPGPIGRIASGGELSRFLLAVKVALTRANPVPTIVFDEVDAGIGGATAAAVGQRLARLAERVQVLVVTHSPQVAAAAAQHWRVVKRDGAAGAVTRIEKLPPEGRREEIARMLAGSRVTEEARAAADRLIGARRR